MYPRNEMSSSRSLEMDRTFGGLKTRHSNYSVGKRDNDKMMPHIMNIDVSKIIANITKKTK